MSELAPVYAVGLVCFLLCAPANHAEWFAHSFTFSWMLWPSITIVIKPDTFIVHPKHSWARSGMGYVMADAGTKGQQAPRHEK